MKAKVFSKLFLQCPNCDDGDFNINHLPKIGSYGPWACKCCGTSIRFKKVNEDINIEIDDHLRTSQDRVAILKLKHSDFWLLKDHSDYGDEWRKSDDYRFLYEEHQCPVSLVNSSYGVVIEGSTDKHGAFEFLGFMPRPEDPDYLEQWIEKHRPDLYSEMFHKVKNLK